MFRILCGAFTLAYFCVRAPIFFELADRSATSFTGVGLWAFRDAPLPPSIPLLLLFLVITSGIVATLGLGYRVTAPCFALAALLLTSYRSSWGQLLHFENLFTLHLLVLAFSPAADVWSLDARRRAPVRRERGVYGFPLALSALIMIITYVLAGIAKVRYGGVGWLTGDTLQNHIAYSAARLELLGGSASPLAAPMIERAGLLSWFAALTIGIELAAPLALLGSRASCWWVAAAWSLHVGVMASMYIVFPYPLFLVAFAPLFDLEHLGFAVTKRYRATRSY